MKSQVGVHFIGGPIGKGCRCPWVGRLPRPSCSSPPTRPTASSHSSSGDGLRLGFRRFSQAAGLLSGFSQGAVADLIAPLVEKTGDPNVRMKDAAADVLLFLAETEEVRPSVGTRPVQANCRTHRPQKLKRLISLYVPIRYRF
jgi:hypothetical protein